MVLAFAHVLIAHGHNPAERLWVQCIDVDRMAALMCYVQLSLWHIPAQVIVGNTLTLELREEWCTPAHYLGHWPARLERQKRTEAETPPDPLKAKMDVIDDATMRLLDKDRGPEQGPDYESHRLDWKGQALEIRWQPAWLGGTSAHLEILSEDRSPHPISETGYRSHFVGREAVENAGGPVAYVRAWLEELGGKDPVQLSLF